MANGYRSSDFVKGGTSNDVAASATKQAVTTNFIITGEDSRDLIVRVVASSVTVAAAISAILQSSFDGGTTWIDNETVSITADGGYNLHHFADGTNSPLWPLGRVVITTGAGDAVTVDNVYVSRRI